MEDSRALEQANARADGPVAHPHPSPPPDSCSQHSRLPIAGCLPVDSVQMLVSRLLSERTKARGVSEESTQIPPQHWLSIQARLLEEAVGAPSPLNHLLTLSAFQMPSFQGWRPSPRQSQHLSFHTDALGYRAPSLGLSLTTQSRATATSSMDPGTPSAPTTTTTTGWED